jgi:hypothetical protein
MTIDELLAARRREGRRLDSALPYSPEWDAAMAAVEDLDMALLGRQQERGGGQDLGTIDERSGNASPPEVGV